MYPRRENLRVLDSCVALPQDDKEVTASAVLLRSTLFTWCFLDYWLGLEWRGENRDNGALLMVSQLVRAVAARRCQGRLCTCTAEVIHLLAVSLSSRQRLRICDCCLGSCLIAFQQASAVICCVWRSHPC